MINNILQLYIIYLDMVCSSKWSASCGCDAQNCSSEMFGSYLWWWPTSGWHLCELWLWLGGSKSIWASCDCACQNRSRQSRQRSTSQCHTRRTATSSECKSYYRLYHVMRDSTGLYSKQQDALINSGGWEYWIRRMNQSIDYCWLLVLIQVSYWCWHKYFTSILTQSSATPCILTVPVHLEQLGTFILFGDILQSLLFQDNPCKNVYDKNGLFCLASALSCWLSLSEVSYVERIPVPVLYIPITIGDRIQVGRCSDKAQILLCQQLFHDNLVHLVQACQDCSCKQDQKVISQPDTLCRCSLYVA